MLHPLPVSLNRRLSKWLIVLIVCFVAFLATVQRIPVYQQVDNTSIQQISTKFAFMKNHKCGSSTIENIIFRFAYNNHLNVVLPAKGNYLSKTQLFNHTSLNGTEWKDLPLDIFSLHNRWNRKEVMKVLKEDVPTFAIIRNPVDVFVSMFYYFDKLKEIYGVRGIHEIVQMIQFTPQLPVLNKRWQGFIGRNQMAWDMGLSPEIFDDPVSLEIEIERLDKEFDLVMISDRMDESLVLLKELLGWPLENVLHLDLNRRKPDKTQPLSSEERVVLKKWLSADTKIYEHFSNRFQERVSELNNKHSSPFFLWRSSSPNYVEQEILKLKLANTQLYDYCVIREVGNEKLQGKFKRYNKNIVGYLINEEHDGCALYSMSEPAYLKIFRESLLKKAHDENGIRK